MTGALLGFASSALAQNTVVAAPLSFSQWLQNVANLMKVIELGAFVFSAYQFWAGRRERRVADADNAERARVDSNYQAWQVINSAQGKGGSGGRVEALADLLRNGVSLAGVTLDDAWLEGVKLPHATLTHSSFRRAQLSKADLSGANLEGADLREADLVTANLSGANLKGANLTGARLSAATLEGAFLTDVIGWREVRSISHASIEGVRSAPVGFVAYALENGAVNAESFGGPEDEMDGYSKQFRAL
ncbi:MAG: pentapeptide repeat-containing protein [Gemmatimonadaceae bacterium]|nr:pentapeptide repeat-containing protein [Gemmatimonadaceae bacterium]